MKTHVIGQSIRWGGGSILAALLLLLPGLAYAAFIDHGVSSVTANSVTQSQNKTTGYVVVDTGQTKCYDAYTETTSPLLGQPFYGQDAQFAGIQSSYTLSGDGKTVLDNVTQLTWMSGPNTTLTPPVTSDKKTFSQAQAWVATVNGMNYGGYSDWRLPTIKELYSLMNFKGTDLSGSFTGTDTSVLTPFIDTTYFRFAYGNPGDGDRIIDSQYASSNVYVVNSLGTMVFGLNLADGRIKGYGLAMLGGSEKTFFVQLVRGRTDYGNNSVTDNGDGTVTDASTGLMWSRTDSGVGMTWQDAMAWAQTKDAQDYLGHNDWRVPNAKELHSIVDYANAPDYNGKPAIDTDAFTCTGITNENGIADYPYYWTSTTHAKYLTSTTTTGEWAVYIPFGRALGYTLGWVDIHGAGCQRSDPKVGPPYPFATTQVVTRSGVTYTGYAFGPQGDALRGLNFVRLVRSAGIATSFSADFTAHSTWGKPPMTVEFKGSVTGTGENVIDWRWDFGDGEVLEGDNPNPKHVYWDEGTYTVSLKATTPSSITTVTKRNLILVSESLPVSQPATLGALIVILILLGKVLVHKHQLEKTK